MATHYTAVIEITSVNPEVVENYGKTIMPRTTQDVVKVVLRRDTLAQLVTAVNNTLRASVSEEAK